MYQVEKPSCLSWTAEVRYQCRKVTSVFTILFTVVFPTIFVTVFATVYTIVFATVSAFAEVWYHRIFSPTSLPFPPTYSSSIRVGSDAEESPLKKAKGNGIELNARGIPARKRKKNSLIYGADDLVGIFIIISLIFLINY